LREVRAPHSPQPCLRHFVTLLQRNSNAAWT
jgi:hypothetical protein